MPSKLQEHLAEVNHFFDNQATHALILYKLSKGICQYSKLAYNPCCREHQIQIVDEVKKLIMDYLDELEKTVLEINEFTDPL